MVLGAVIKFNSGGIANGAGLASGVNIDNLATVQKFAQSRMKQAGKLSIKATAQTVFSAAKIAGAMEGNAELVRDLSQQKIRQARAGIQILQAGMSHDEAMMQIEEQYQDLMDKHGRKRLQHRYKTGLNQSESVGYHEAYSRGSSFDSM
ncbi:MAG TPA: hypothetical protein V6C63_06855 [Allocoleopsis sp.]